MPSGGARARSGSAPDPNALRRERDSGEWSTLPAEGRKGETPPWPLTRARKRELALWEDLWRKPQAVVWERQGQHGEVAMYCRRMVEAETPGCPAASVTAWRQLHDSLGLSTPGLRSNRWRIGADKPASLAAASGPTPLRRVSSRDRLKVVAGSDPGGGPDDDSA